MIYLFLFEIFIYWLHGKAYGILLPSSLTRDGTLHWTHCIGSAEF